MRFSRECRRVESFLNCGFLLSRLAPHGDSGILSRVAHSSSYKPPARPLGLLRQCLLHCQHGGLWSRASHARREPVRAVGLHPLPKWSLCTEAGSKRYINIIGQRNGVWPPACVTSSSGRTSRPGEPRSNPQGAGTDRPCCLLSTACLKTNSTILRETCEDRRARLPCGDAVPDV